MHPSFLATLSILASLLTLACASSEGDQSRDTTAPRIVVTSPDRGTTSSAETLVVEGLVTDDESGIESVTISGVSASVDENGLFRAELALAHGLNLLQVTATDRSGNQSTSTRAVLSGLFAPADQPVQDAARVYIGQETLAAVADTSEAVLAGLDLDPLLASANPIVSQGTSNCLNATVDLDDLRYDDLQVTLVPVDGGIRALVDIQGLEASASAHHKIACIGGNTAIVIAADEAEVEAELQIAVSGGSFVASVVTSVARFDNLSVDVGILPSSVIEFVVGDLDEKLGAQLSAFMARELPPLVESNIAKLSANHEVQLLGTALTVAVHPAAVAFDDDGGTIFLETQVAAPGRGTPYLSTPMPLPALHTESGLSVAIADDAINQALSALWDTGALNRRVELTSESGADLGGGILNRMQVSAPLPPVIGADADDGSLKLTIGDMYIDLLKDGEPSAVSRIAVSLEMEISVVASNGEVRLRTEGQPTIYMDRLDAGGFLNDRDLEILVAFASTMLAGDLNRLLGEIPLPSVAGTEIANATVTAQGGYLQVSANLIR